MPRIERSYLLQALNGHIRYNSTITKKMVPLWWWIVSSIDNYTKWRFTKVNADYKHSKENIVGWIVDGLKNFKELLYDQF